MGSFCTSRVITMTTVPGDLMGIHPSLPQNCGRRSFTDSGESAVPFPANRTAISRRQNNVLPRFSGVISSQIFGICKAVHFLRGLWNPCDAPRFLQVKAVLPSVCIGTAILHRWASCWNSPAVHFIWNKYRLAFLNHYIMRFVCINILDILRYPFYIAITFCILRLRSFSLTVPRYIGAFYHTYTFCLLTADSLSATVLLLRCSLISRSPSTVGFDGTL